MKDHFPKIRVLFNILVIYVTPVLLIKQTAHQRHKKTKKKIVKNAIVGCLHFNILFQLCMKNKENKKEIDMYFVVVAVYCTIQSTHKRYHF